MIFRHTYASLLASAGFSLPMIGALLGHTQPQTTARYAHLFDDPLRQATERVGAIITGKAAGEGRSSFGADDECRRRGGSPDRWPEGKEPPGQIRSGEIHEAFMFGFPPTWTIRILWRGVSRGGIYVGGSRR